MKCSKNKSHSRIIYSVWEVLTKTSDGSAGSLCGTRSASVAQFFKNGGWVACDLVRAGRTTFNLHVDIGALLRATVLYSAMTVAAMHHPLHGGGPGCSRLSDTLLGN